MVIDEEISKQTNHEVSALNRATLVLNRGWQPLHVAPVSRALIMVWNGNARVVDPRDFQLFDWHDWAQMTPGDEEPCVRTVDFAIRVPEAVVLSHFDRMPVQGVTFSRRNVFRRDKMTCQYCGKQPGSDELTIDHVLPRAQGGQSSWTNCVLACISCNSKKADRTPDQAGMKLRNHPVEPRWRPQFAAGGVRIESWKQFISEAYWNVPLEP